MRREPPISICGQTPAILVITIVFADWQFHIVIMSKDEHITIVDSVEHSGILESIHSGIHTPMFRIRALK